MVLTHELPGLGADDAGAIERAAAQQHQGEAVIVAHGGSETAACIEQVRAFGIEFRGRAAGIGERRLTRLGVLLVASHQTVDLLGRHPEIGVVHAERAKDAFTEEFVERLAGNDFHERAEHVDGVAVTPLRARREGKRQLADLAGHVLQRVLRVADLAVAVDLVGLVLEQEAVGEAGRVGDEIKHRHLAVWFAQLRRRRRAAIPHHRVLVFGNVAADRMVEPDLALLEQHHDGERRDRLGHRIDAEDRLGTDGFLAAHLGRAGIALVRDLPAARDQQAHAGHLAGVDIVGLEIGGHRGEPVCIQADFVRVCGVVVEHQRFPALAARASSRAMMICWIWLVPS